MANKTSSVQPETAAQVLTYGDFKLDVGTASAAAISYLLQHGYNASMQESIAGVAKKLKDEGKDEAAITAGLNEVLSKRHDAILGGTIGHRSGGPKLRGLEATVQDVALERVKAHYAKKGWKLPSGKGAADEVRAIIAKYMANETRAEDVRAEAKRRFDALAAADDFEP